MRFIVFFSISLACLVHCFQSHQKLLPLSLNRCDYSFCSSVPFGLTKSAWEQGSKGNKGRSSLILAAMENNRANNNISPPSQDIEELYRQAMEEDAEWFRTYITPKLGRDNSYGEEKSRVEDDNSTRGGNVKVDESRAREHYDNKSPLKDQMESQSGKSFMQQSSTPESSGKFGNETVDIVAQQQKRATLKEEKMEASEKISHRTRLMKDAPNDPFYTDEQKDSPRQQPDWPSQIPSKRRRRLDVEDQDLLLDQQGNRKMKRRDTTTIRQRYGKEKTPSSEELPGTKFWPGIRPFKDALRSELYLRASILDLFGNRFRKLKQPLKMEGKMRYKLYSSWLKLLKNGIGEPILSLDYEDERRSRNDTPKKKYYGEQTATRRRRNSKMRQEEDEVESSDERKGLKKSIKRSGRDDATSGGSRRSFAAEKDFEHSRFRDTVDDT